MIEYDDDFLDSLISYPIIWVGFSGGMDSMVLLHWVVQNPLLRQKCRAIHIHHGLSENADDWLKFCSIKCEEFNIPLIYENVQVSSQCNVEAAARELRYAVYQKYVQSSDILLLGHHLDDQIETYFLKLLRGSGLEGLSGMPKIKTHMGMCLARPLLQHTRMEIQEYAMAHQLSWIEDESNDNRHFARNYLRHEVLPKIEAYWPQYRKSLQKTLTIFEQSHISLEEQAYTYYPELANNPPQLSCQHLRFLTTFQVGIILRIWFKQKNLSCPGYEVMNEIYSQMVLNDRQDALPYIHWGEVHLYAYQEQLYVFDTPFIAYQNQLWSDFPNPLQMSSRLKLTADLSVQGFQYIRNQDVLEVRFRQGGEIFYWKGHHRCLKKLFQAWKVPPFLRDQIPLIYVNGILKQVVGYACEYEENPHSSQFQVSYLT